MMTIQATAELLHTADDFLILTHRKPDGDTIGSAGALCRALRALGKRAFVHPNEEITERLAFLCEGLLAPASFEPAFIIAVDIASVGLLPDSAQRYGASIDLSVDHHGSNTGYAAHTALFPERAAVGEIVYQLVRALGVTIDLPMYDALYVAVSTDTGCFRFSNTTPLSHRIAAECIEHGCDFHALNRTFFINKSNARFLIERYLFDNLIFTHRGRVASVVIPRAFLQSSEASNDDIDNLSTLLMQLEQVECGLLLVEGEQEGVFKVSVRTQKPYDASSIAARFGGGGHARAAGCTMVMPGEQARAALAEAAAHEIERAGA